MTQKTPGVLPSDIWFYEKPCRISYEKNKQFDNQHRFCIELQMVSLAWRIKAQFFDSIRQVQASIIHSSSANSSNLFLLPNSQRQIRLFMEDSHYWSGSVWVDGYISSQATW